jgi:hypothetical protein
MIDGNGDNWRNTIGGGSAAFVAPGPLRDEMQQRHAVRTARHRDGDGQTDRTQQPIAFSRTDRLVRAGH